jgi:AdoMet-dependent rRNA methyltransferase SPB1
MGKKTKSKQRLDEYYRFAKTQGYRSRAAYKLIQLNRKYGFLNQATTVIDLCSAPGGWLQVCASTMPSNSIIIGIDLVEIKKVPGTITLKGDITKSETFTALKRELKNRKCDAVLNDGAPNVGASWSKDAYTQSELVLAAFKLATEFLRPKGSFVTKVFRSTDTNSLMWVFKKFF